VNQKASAVAANIVKTPNFVPVTDDQQVRIKHPSRKQSSGPLELGNPSCTKPMCGKNGGFFAVKNFPRRDVTSVQGSRTARCPSNYVCHEFLPSIDSPVAAIDVDAHIPLFSSKTVRSATGTISFLRQFEQN
jgi:hypothetical protein